VYRHISQSCCPWNIRFSQELKEPSFAAREAIARKDARTLAREILAMSDEDFRTAFKRSPMKRAKLRGLKRNAAVVLGNVGSFDDVDVLAPTLDDHDSLQREHADWAISRLRTANAHQFTRVDAGHSLPRAESDRL
jgi:epoxyqueuosine reductase